MPKKKEKGKEVAEVRGDTSSRAAPTKKKVKKEADVNGWLDKNVDELVSALGLEYLGLSRDEYLEILRRPVELLYGSPSTKPDVETIVKRFRRFSESVYPLIAVALLNLKEDLKSEHLDFIVNNIGKAVLEYAPKLYKEAVRLGREDVLPTLRRLWRIAWIEQHSKTLPVTCPKCLFNSLTKDMYCLVCGSVVSEKQLKEFLDFRELLKNYVNSVSCEELRELTRYDYVLLNNNGIKHPKELREEGVDIEVLLSNDEKTLIKQKYRELCGDELRIENTSRY
jgi:hypothetical protein